MSISPSIIVGLAVMAIWGFEDFIMAIPLKRIGTNKTILLTNLFALVPICIISAYFLFRGQVSISQGDFLMLFAASIIDVFAIYFFWKSMEVGEVSIVSPVSATYPLVTILLSIALAGEMLSPLKIICMFAVVVGAVLTSSDLSKLRHLHAAKGVGLAFAAMMIWGVYFYMVGMVERTTDYISVFVFTNLIATPILIGYSYLKAGRGLKRDRKIKSVIWPIAAVSLLATAGWFVLNYGYSLGQVSLVTTVSSLYPIITVMLAMAFFKEKLVMNQKIGIVVTIAGLFLLSL